MNSPLESESEADAVIYLAKKIGIDPKKLAQTLGLLELRESKCYNLVLRPKRDGGQRLISIPNGQLKTIQQGLNRHILAGLKPGPNAFGFSGGGVKEAINPHLGAGSIFCADISSAFPRVNWNRVFNTLCSNGLSKSTARIIADLTTCGDFRVLPQGAPTSPRLFDLACRQLDFEITELAKEYGAQNTRYADNIFFSLRQPEFPRQLKIKIIKLLHTNWPFFGWHHLVIKKPTREPVRILGLNIVQGKINNTRAFKRRLRLAVHHCNWLLNKGKRDSDELEMAWKKLRGQMGFARTDTLPQKLLNDYAALQTKLSS